MTKYCAMNRRRFLTLTGLAITATGLSGCVSAPPTATTPAGGGASGPSGASSAASAENPFGVPSSGSAEMVYPTSGYGTEYIKKAVAQFNKKFSGVNVTMTEMKDMKTTLQPRFVSGDVPDWVFNMGLDLPSLSDQGQIADLTSFYAAPAEGFDGKTVKDVLLPGTYELGLVGETPRYLQYTLMVQGFWRSKKLFESKGWSEPKTVDEFYALCDKIKSAGIAPMAYQGQYPSYLVWHYITMATREMGKDNLKKVMNLEQGAWEQPAMLKAAQFYATMRKEGYFLEGTEGLNHTQSQTYWAQGKAAYLPCGGWIEAEMGDLIPKDFGLTLTPPPQLSSQGAMPYETILAMAGGAFFVPEKAKNKAAGLELLRTIVSKEYARTFTELTKNMVSLKDYMDPATKISDGLDTQVEVVRKAGDNVVAYLLETWYPKLGKTVSDNIGDLAKGSLSPEQFIEKCQKAADATASDSSIPKFRA